MSVPQTGMRACMEGFMSSPVHGYRTLRFVSLAYHSVQKKAWRYTFARANLLQVIAECLRANMRHKLVQ